jgi:hypothetical protein
MFFSPPIKDKHKITLYEHLKESTIKIDRNSFLKENRDVTGCFRKVVLVFLPHVNKKSPMKSSHKMP